MQRVAQVVTRFIAGAGGVALRGSLALDPNRYAVTVLAADGGPLLAQAESAGIEVVRLRHLRPEINLREDWAALAELRRELGAREFEIVHTHSSKAGALGRLAAHEVGGVAIVHTYHGFPFNRFQTWPRRTAYLAIERRLGLITDRFLAIGNEVAAEAVRLGIAPPDRVLSVASAIDSSIPQVNGSSRTLARARLGIPLDAPLIGTVGRIDHQKAPEDMLAAYVALGRPDTWFVWIGDGPLSGRLAREVSRRGLNDRFLIVGERADVGELLPGLDVFAMASLFEGLPCALVEAMTCGIPVVASAVNGVPDVVHAGKTGLLAPPRAPETLSRAIAYLLDHPEHARLMATAARAEVQGRFDPERLGQDLMETYERALADRLQSRLYRVSAA